MSLFQYRVSLVGGKEKTGKITAKTEKEARERLARENVIVEWLAMREEPAANLPKTVILRTKAEAVKPKAVIVKPAALTKMQKMLFLQHGRCFFCGEPLAPGEASIEHLNPKASGGTSTEDNEVVCHATLNQTFGSMDLKRKFEFVLRSTGPIKCPPGK